LVSVFVVALTGILVDWTNDRLDRSEVLNGLAGELLVHYQLEHDWHGSEPILKRAQTIFGRRRGPDWAFFLADAEERVIFCNRKDQIGLPLTQVHQLERVPLQLEGDTIGFVGVTSAYPQAPGSQLELLSYVGSRLLMTAAVVAVSGIVFGMVMSRSLTAPLNHLAQTAKTIDTRDLSRRVEEKGSDEMIAVARSFNEMVAGLEQAEQLRRNLLADVAHELRTPLSVLQANLQAILDEVYPLDQSEIARLYEQTRFLSRLVNDLHELAQAEAKQLPLTRQETDLAPLVKTTAETFRPNAELKGVTVQTDLPPADSVPPLNLDVARFTQVLQNLLSNALRHTPAEGTITVQLKPETEAVLLSISDTGEGIPPEHQPYIFDRFYRADLARSRDRGGAGLGLAIARAIIEAHNGQIKVASSGNPGQGSTFTIRLPLK
jgi:signal transduction histidine kinase